MRETDVQDSLRIDSTRDAAAAAARIEENPHAENAAVSAVFAQCTRDPEDPAPLDLFVRSPSGEPVAGAGSAAAPSRGGGSQKLGRTRVRLFTRSFQAPEFYRKMGYEPYGPLEEFPPGASEQYFQKRL